MRPLWMVLALGLIIMILMGCSSLSDKKGPRFNEMGFVEPDQGIGWR